MSVKYGSRGKEVTYVQELLVRVGHLSAKQVDGIAKDITIQAIVNYQKAIGLSVDGVAGPVTVASLESGNLAHIAEGDMVSEHFSFSELTKSATAQSKGISNIPNTQEKRNIIFCAAQLEIIRAHLSKKTGKDVPLYVSSCFRSEEVNRLVKGAKNSAHRYGLAIDFTAAKFGNTLNLAKEIISMQSAGLIEFDQLILEFPPSGWIHIGFKQDGKNQRKEVLTAKKIKGRTQYLAGLKP